MALSMATVLEPIAIKGKSFLPRDTFMAFVEPSAFVDP